jgi:hypothetical protein
MTHRPNGKRWRWAACVLLAALSVSSAAADADPTVPIPIRDLIGAIDNHDVRWDGALIGLLPELRGASGLLEKHCARDVSGELLRALDGPRTLCRSPCPVGKTKSNEGSHKWRGVRRASGCALL